MSDQKAVGELFDKVFQELGPIGGVVCNAGEASCAMKVVQTDKLRLQA